MTDLIIHGHFYQPPRENPRTGEIERQPSAKPFHDWNERIHAECYGPNAFARIGGDVAERVVNNYSAISFNFGPTLLSWLEKHHPRTYQRILEADRVSAARYGGHGNAIAQAYSHTILPLANPRDRLTQVIWGLEDFRFRFGREPESIWLPETACNDETLELLIEQGMRYVILSPEQTRRIRHHANQSWTDVSNGNIDTTKPYRFFHHDGSRRSLAVFFYHGPLSRAIAFEKALTSSRELVDRFIRSAQNGLMINVATDGETYGHHFKFGDLCLAHALEVEAPQAGFQITNYGEYLDHHEPDLEVEINNGADGEGTSWSCSHGVGRWSRDCGCYTGGELGWNQLWRAPLRAALEFLRADAADNFERLGRDVFKDPWKARNAYINVILGKPSAEAYLVQEGGRALSQKEQRIALQLLEIQRNSLLMFTSCGWFFSDLGGIETVQVMRYAARVIELQKELGIETPRARFLEILSEARSNVIEKGTGADIFLRLVESEQRVSDKL
jgi:alpha-amylase/alpha-mannosidase (GH57 family)